MQNPENSPASRPNAPKPAPQNQDAEPAFIEHADEVRALLGEKVPETAAAEWNDLMGLVRSVPEHPRDAPESLHALQREELNRRYERIRDYRTNALLALQVSAAALTQRNPARLSENEQDTVLRLVAQYVRERRLYDQIIAEDSVLNVNLPSYLAVYVQLEQRERFSLNATDRLLYIQYDVLDQANEGLSKSDKISVQPQVLAPYASQILRRAIRRDLTISHIRPCLQEDGTPITADAPFIDFLQTTGFDAGNIHEHDIHAAKMLIGFLSKYLPKTEQLAEFRGVDVDTLQLNTITESMAFSSVLNHVMDGLVDQGLNIVQGNPPDLRSIADSVLQNAEPFTGAANEIVLGGLVLQENSTAEERESFQQNMDATVDFMMSSEADAVYLNEIYDDANSAEGLLSLKDSQKDIIVAMARKVQTPEFIERIISITDLTESNVLLYMRHGDWSAEVQTTLRSMLEHGTLSVKDAYQLYYLFETSGAISLPVAFKIVEILDKYENSNLADLFQHGVIRRLMDIIDANNIDAAIAEIGLEGEAANAVRHFEEKWQGLIPGMWDRLVQWHINYPLYAFAIDAMAIPSAYRGYIAVRMWRTERFATMDPAEAVRKFHPEALADPELYRTALQRVQTAQQELNSLLNQNRRLSILQLDRGMRLRGRAFAIFRTRKLTELTDIATKIKGKYGSVENVAAYLAQMSPDEEALQTALRSAGYSGEEVDTAFTYLRATDNFQFDDLIDAVANPATRLNHLASESTLSAVDRRRMAQQLVGEGLDDSIRLADAVVDVHNFNNAELRQAYAALDAAEDAGDGVREARRRVQKILLEKRNRLMEEWGLPRSKANALVRSGICGLDDTARVMELIEGVNPAVATRLAETVTNIVPRNLDELRTAIRGVSSYDDALELIRGYHGQAAELNVAKYIELLEDDHLIQLARSAKRLDQLKDIQQANRMAAQAARKAKLLRGGGIAAGVSLTAFGVFIDGYMMHLTSERIQEAKERGDTEAARILESKWYSEAGEAGFGVATGGLGMAGVLSGPPGWVALGGLMVKAVSSEYLYSYALDLNATNTRQYLRLKPEQQMALLRGRGNWLIDSQKIRNFRYEIAFDAYVQSVHLAGLSQLDLQYMREVLAKNPSWLREDLADPNTLQRMHASVLQEKNAYLTKDFREFNNANGFNATIAEHIEVGSYYAELKHIERRAEQLNKPEIFIQALTDLGIEHGNNNLQPSDMLQPFRRTYGRRTTMLYKETPLSKAMREKKIQSLYYELIMLKTLVDKNEMDYSEAHMEFTMKVQNLLFKHDINIFLAEVADDTRHDRLLHDQTIAQISYYEIGRLFKLGSYERSEVFVRELQKLHKNLREFYAKREPFTLRQLGHNGSFFGSNADKPLWYLQDPLNMRKRRR